MELNFIDKENNNKNGNLEGTKLFYDNKLGNIINLNK